MSTDPKSSVPPWRSTRSAAEPLAAIPGQAGAPPARRALLITGMHRSGTSALARVLNLLGCDLPKTLMEPGKDNEAGFWESQAIADFNDALLQSAGSSWHDWLPLDPRWYSLRVADEFKDRALKLLAQEYDDFGLFVLKDPRICRLLPFWLDALETARVQPAVVLILRNPLEVAGSLQARDAFDAGLSQLLWLRHVLEAEAASRGRLRFHCGYDELMRSWPALIGRAQETLRLSFPRQSNHAFEEIGAFLAKELRHHREAPSSVINNATLPAWLRDAFEILDRWAEQGERVEDYFRLDRIRTEFDAAAPAFAPVIAAANSSAHKMREFAQSLDEMHAQLSSIHAAAASHAEHVQRLQTEVTEAERALTATRAKLSHTQSELLQRKHEPPPPPTNVRRAYVGVSENVNGGVTSTFPPMHFFTICARNYLAMAAVLSESLAKHHPASTLTVFLLDPDDLPPRATNLNIRPIQDAVPPDEYDKRRCYYDLLELSTCVKPRCFQKLFAEGAQVVVYLDPDIYVFRPMIGIEHAFSKEGAQGVVIPHILSPLPDDGASPDDLAILRSGVYNLGFLALSNGSDTGKFLNWWDQKLKWQCFRDPREGVFTDQKWMEFAPIFLPQLNVLRDETYDVAYWNLSERQLGRTQTEEWEVNGNPLSFFHFSGFDPTKKNILSKHEDRVGEAEGALRDLLSFYASRLHAHRHNELSRTKFAEAIFATGETWDPVCRLLYRRRVAGGERRLNPLGDASFMSWMASTDEGQEMPRYIQALLSLRSDVAIAYPEVPGRDWNGLVTWLTNSGPRELGIDLALLEALGFVKSNKGHIPRITYAGYLNTHLGLGEAARGNLEALGSAGVPMSVIDFSKDTISETGSYRIVEACTTNAAFQKSDIDIIHVNADQLQLLLHKYAPFLRSQVRIGVWAWETSEFPSEWNDRFGLIDELWVPSHFVANAVSPKATCPVVIVPYAVNVPTPNIVRSELGISGREFTFLVQFDYLSVPHRKNPEATIGAFKAAFPGNEPVKLIVKTMNGNHDPACVERLKCLSDDGRIVFWDEALEGDRRYALLAAADCYLSLHRAEGFGLSLAESMAYGKPVIATGWSGNLEFMNVSNSILIPYRLERLPFDAGPYRAGTLWAEADLDVAATAMRRVFQDRRWADSIGARAKADIRSNLSPEVIGKRLRERLSVLADSSSQHTAAYTQSHRNLEIERALIVDLVRHPIKYLSNSSRAWTYYRTFGYAALKQRILSQAVRSKRRR